MSDEQSEDLWTWLAPLQGVVACLACDPQREGANLTIVSKEAARSAVIFAPQGTTGCANSPSPSPPRLAAVLEHSSERKKGNAADETPRRSEDPVGDESHRESAHQQQHPWRSAVESAAPDSNQQGSKGSFGSSFTRSAGLINVEFVRQRHETIVGESARIAEELAESQAALEKLRATHKRRTQQTQGAVGAKEIGEYLAQHKKLEKSVNDLTDKLYRTKSTIHASREAMRNASRKVFGSKKDFASAGVHEIIHSAHLQINARKQSKPG